MPSGLGMVTNSPVAQLSLTGHSHPPGNGDWCRSAAVAGKSRLGLWLLRNNRLRLPSGGANQFAGGSCTRRSPTPFTGALFRQLTVAEGYLRSATVRQFGQQDSACDKANAGKINANVQTWTLPMEFSSQTEMPLLSQQSAPLTLVWETSSRCLSKNEPTIASTVPMSSDGINTLDSTAN